MRVTHHDDTTYDGQYASNQPDDPNDQCRGRLAGTSEARIHLDHFLCLQSLTDGQWPEDDAAAKQSNDGHNQSFVGFFAGNGGFFGDWRSTAQGHGFAGSAIFLALDINETIGTKGLRATCTTICRRHVGMIFALHRGFKERLPGLNLFALTTCSLNRNKVMSMNIFRSDGKRARLDTVLNSWLTWA
jgi:hypothetical protein